MIADLPRRVRQAVALTAPLVLIEMARHGLGWPEWHGRALAVWQGIMAGVTSLVVFGPGLPLLAKGWASFRRRRLNMFSLIAPGVLISYAYSMMAFAFPDLFPESFRQHGHIPVYFEAAAMITTLVLLGQFLEARAERHTGDALEALARLAPARTCIIREGREYWVETEKLQAGDHIQLRAGDRVPADGPVVRGEVFVDESMLTGEPLPAARRSGSRLVGGTMIREGAAIMRANKVGNDTTLAHIVRLVKTAQESKAPIQRIADRVTGKLVPLVFLIAGLTFVAWWQFGPAPSLWYALIHAVTVLMITCPCALGLATPLSIMVGLGRGALRGILIKQAAALEKLSGVTTLVLDKTGTLTEGRPTLHACIPAEPGQENLVLKLAASVEQKSHHPLARAVVAGAVSWGLTPDEVQSFTSRAGEGVAARLHHQSVLVGNEPWLTHHHVTPSPSLSLIAGQYEAEGRMVIWVARDQEVMGILVLADALKPNTERALAGLRKRGIRLVMLTGDRKPSAERLGRQLRLDEVHAEVKPEEKAAHVEALRREGAVVAMAGDGINDAPALAAADIGISMGTGTDVAVASGDINLLHGDPMGLVHAIELSRAVMKNIRQNLFFAFAYNLIMIPLAAGALFPWTGWLLTPMLASAAMTASSLTVTANALRLKSVRREE